MNYAAVNSVNDFSRSFTNSATPSETPFWICHFWLGLFEHRPQSVPNIYLCLIHMCHPIHNSIIQCCVFCSTLQLMWTRSLIKIYITHFLLLVFLLLYDRIFFMVKGILIISQYFYGYVFMVVKICCYLNTRFSVLFHHVSVSKNTMWFMCMVYYLIMV